jgi:hypothetical protein
VSTTGQWAISSLRLGSGTGVAVGGGGLVDVAGTGVKVAGRGVTVAGTALSVDRAGAEEGSIEETGGTDGVGKEVGESDGVGGEVGDGGIDVGLADTIGCVGAVAGCADASALETTD